MVHEIDHRDRRGLTSARVRRKDGFNARQPAPILRADAPLGPAYSLVYE
jgi:hypothetical protein